MKHKMWKRAAVVLLSVILSLGMSGWMDPLEVSAIVGRPTFWVELPIPGYEGEGIPEIGKFYTELRVYDDDPPTIMSSEEMKESWDGKTLRYTVEIEFGRWKKVAIYLEYSNGDRVILGGVESSDYLRIDSMTCGGPLVRWTFMDGSDVYYERYVRGLHSEDYKRKPADPVKEGQEFLGWSEDGSESKIVDYDQFALSYALAERYTMEEYQPVTLYAVWGHAHTWEWQSDSDCHWGTCSGCGDSREQEGHTWDGGRVTKEPTITETGEKTYTCTICGRTMIETIPVKDAPTDNGNDGVSDNNSPDNGSDADGSGNTDNNVNGDEISTGAENVSINASANKNNEPETGYTFHVEIYATAAMIAGLLYLLLSYAEKKGLTETKKKEIISSIISWANEGRKYRRYMALAAIFFVLVYYHSIGRSTTAEAKCVY